MFKLGIIVLILNVVFAGEQQPCGYEQQFQFKEHDCLFANNLNHKLCVNPGAAQTYFTYHVVQPFLNQTGNGAECEDHWGWGSCEYIVDRKKGPFNPDNQFEHFAVLRINQISIKKRVYFVHLNFIPCADFQSRFCACFVEKSAPAFIAIKEGNWAVVERFIRKVIVNPTEVFTGQFGTLTLRNSRNELTAMYLGIPDRSFEDLAAQILGLTSKTDDLIYVDGLGSLKRLNRVKVPEFFYKVIRDTVTNEGLVLITSNNPFLDFVQNNDFQMMCRENLCAFSTVFQKSVNGYTYCCDVVEFLNNLKSIHKIYFDGVLDYKTVKRPTDIRAILVKGGLFEK